MHLHKEDVCILMLPFHYIQAVSHVMSRFRLLTMFNLTLCKRTSEEYLSNKELS